jgi:hypothetical protein
MGDKTERVVVELPATAVRFAEACAGGRDISRVIEAGLKSLACELMKEEAREFAQDSHYLN